MRLLSAICQAVISLILVCPGPALAERDAIQLSRNVEHLGLPEKSLRYINDWRSRLGGVSVEDLVRGLTAGRLWAMEPVRASDKLPILEILERHGLHLGMTGEEIEYYRNYGRLPPATLNTSVDAMQLRSGTMISLLHRLNVRTFGDSLGLTIQKLRAQPYIGSGTIQGLVAAFAAAGFPLARDAYEAELRAGRAAAGGPSPLDDLVIDSALSESAKSLIFTSTRLGSRRFVRREHACRLHAADLWGKPAFTNRAIDEIYTWLDEKGLRLGMNESEIAAYRYTGMVPSPTRASSVDAFGRMSAKAVHAMQRMGIKLIEDADNLTVAEIRAQPAVGDTISGEIADAFRKAGFPLANEVPGARHEMFLAKDLLEQLRRGTAEYDPQILVRGHIIFDGQADQGAVADYLWRHGIATLGQLVSANRSGVFKDPQWIFLSATLLRLEIALAGGCAARLEGKP